MLRVCDAIIIHCNELQYLGGKRSHIGADFQIWIKSSPPTCKSTTDLVGRHGKRCAKRARKDFIRRVVRAIGQGRNEPRKSLDCGACSYKKAGVRKHLLNFKLNYLTIEAISAAKSSTFFSMPSPFAKRTNCESLMSAPRALATELM